MNADISVYGVSGDINHFYTYFGFAALVAVFFVFKSEVKDKFQLFLISFYLLTGTSNSILTFKIPGVSLFELQPDRVLFLVLLFYLGKKLLFTPRKVSVNSSSFMPWFMVLFFLYITCQSLSHISHIQTLGFSEVLEKISYLANYVVIIYALKTLVSKESFEIIGKSIIIGAFFSSMIGFIQIGIDPLFMRLGDLRPAFGSLLRANGLFRSEYMNAYFLITAIAWVMVTMKKTKLKYVLLVIFSAGVICSFHRMSWVILCLIFVVYFIAIEKVVIERLALAGLSVMVILMVVAVMFSRDIMNSTMVQERLSDSIDGRIGYYSMVYNHIGEKPIFGFGSRNNDVYYYTMLKITNNRDRATGVAGGIHNGYLAIMFFYGIPAFIFFTGFIYFSIYYFARLSAYHLFFAIPFLMGLMYAVGNLTNSLLFPRHLALLYTMHIGLGLGLWKSKNYLPKQTKEPVLVKQF